MDDFDPPSQIREQIKALNRERDAAGHGGNGWPDDDTSPSTVIPAFVVVAAAAVAVAVIWWWL